MIKKRYVVGGLIVLIAALCIMIRWQAYQGSKVINQESVTSEFYDYTREFNIIRDYMVTQPNGYYTPPESYKEETDNIELQQALECVIKELGYGSIKNYRTEEDHYILFIKDYPCKGVCKGKYECYQEYGLIYKVMGEGKYGAIMEPIGEGWYYHWVGYV